MEQTNQADTPLISVIIPVYRVEPFLKRCLDSVCRQSYQNLEIILVDDGSPDNCGKICEEYALRDPRITVLHKANGGLSDARNYGVNRCHGEYITFIDSDDYVSENYVAYLYKLLSENHTDASVCAHRRTGEDSLFPLSEDTTPGCQVVSGVEACHLLFNHMHRLKYDGTAWARLYKAEIVRKYPFPVGRLFEDCFATPKFYSECQSIAFGDKICYAYFINPNSIMGTQARSQKALEDYIWIAKDRTDFFAKRGYSDLVKKSNAQFFTWYTREVIVHSTGRDPRVAELFSKCLLPRKGRLSFLLYQVSPALFRKIWKKRNGVT